MIHRRAKETVAKFDFVKKLSKVLELPLSSVVGFRAVRW